MKGEGGWGGFKKKKNLLKKRSKTSDRRKETISRITKRCKGKGGAIIPGGDSDLRDIGVSPKVIDQPKKETKKDQGQNDRGIKLT